MNKKKLLAVTRPVRHTYKQLRRTTLRGALQAIGRRARARILSGKPCNCSACRGEPL